MTNRASRTFNRIRVLATGRTVWVETATGKEEIQHLPWKIRWAVFGIHAHNWRWVNRYGKQTCGCTINPITRHRVLINGACREHFGPPISERRRPGQE